MRFVILTALPLFTIAACKAEIHQNAGGTSTVETTTVGPNLASDEVGRNGDVDIQADGANGLVALKIQGVEGRFSVPTAMFRSGAFDIDGVKLYPNSDVTNVKVTSSKDSSPSGKSQGDVRIAFVAPAAPADVADWFAARFRDKSVMATRDGKSFNGTTRDGAVFKLSLNAGADKQTNGSYVVTYSK